MDTVDDLSHQQVNTLLSLRCPVVKSILFKLANNNIREAPSVAIGNAFFIHHSCSGTSSECVCASGIFTFNKEENHYKPIT